MGDIKKMNGDYIKHGHIKGKSIYATVLPLIHHIKVILTHKLIEVGVHNIINSLRKETSYFYFLYWNLFD